MRTFDVKVGAGTLRITEGEPEYGQVMVDLVVERDGKEYALPVATIENPNDPEVDSPATKADATTVYVYGTFDCDMFSQKTVIPNSYIDDAVASIKY